MRNLRIVISVFGVLLAAHSSEAATVPVGVQTDVPATTVFDTWGWTVAWQSTYETANNPIGEVFANVDLGQHVMLAAKPVGSDTFTVLAAALESDVRTYTPKNVTHAANDVEWYYNGGSMGFAGLGDSISQSNADTNRTNGALRLSWHTNEFATRKIDYSVPPNNVYFGWRAGTNTHLNNASNWERYVLVPEPSLLVLVDIKPGPSNNTVPLNGNGTLQMAILANEEFDVLDIDIASLLFGDPILVDGGATALGATSDKLRDLNHDGLDDLLVGFSISDLVAGGALDASSVEGRLTGELFDGTPIFGSDIVRMVPQNNGGGGLVISTVPEPATSALALAAVVFFAAGRRRPH